MQPEQVDAVLRQVLLKDMRIQCRARGLSPAGARDELAERLKGHMAASGDFDLKNGLGRPLALEGVAGVSSAHVAGGYAQNFYLRPGGKANIGNIVTSRPSARILAPAGGGKVTVDLSHPTTAGPAAPRAPCSPMTHSQIVLG